RASAAGKATPHYSAAPVDAHREAAARPVPARNRDRGNSGSAAHRAETRAADPETSDPAESRTLSSATQATRAAGGLQSPAAECLCPGRSESSTRAEFEPQTQPAYDRAADSAPQANSPSTSDPPSPTYRPSISMSPRNKAPA